MMVDNDFEWMWEEAIMVQFTILLWYLLVMTEEVAENLSQEAWKV
jgi:hypothetical protein